MAPIRKAPKMKLATNILIPMANFSSDSQPNTYTPIMLNDKQCRIKSFPDKLMIMVVFKNINKKDLDWVCSADFAERNFGF
jgi:hypothetical protein